MIRSGPRFTHHKAFNFQGMRLYVDIGQAYDNSGYYWELWGGAHQQITIDRKSKLFSTRGAAYLDLQRVVLQEYSFDLS